MMEWLYYAWQAVRLCRLYKAVIGDKLVLFEIKNYNVLCGGAGRIPGAVKMATIWLIPKDAEKPIDGRTKQGKAEKYE